MKNITINGVEYTPTIKQKPIILEQTLKFEVYPIDLLGKTTWDEAKKACESLGEGWRLPTRVELLLLYENNNHVGGFAYNFYWSSTEYNYANAWLQSFNSGIQYSSYKYNEYNVQAVRSID